MFDLQLPRVLAALADPHRLATVRFVGTSKSTFSHHLRILREAGIVSKQIRGAKGFMCLRKDDLDRRFPGLLDSVLNADAEPVP